MAERPVECSHCSKPIKTLYKEIVGNETLCTEMCADCPVLKQRLRGKETDESMSEGETSLHCGNCHTGLDALKTGNHLGCSRCYEVFGDLLINELITRNQIPQRLHKALAGRKSQPVHTGKAPGERVKLPSSSRLATLNEALNEALNKENYEQAAWLRDQIKTLKDKSDDGHE